jgi:hypothetical protein
MDKKSVVKTSEEFEEIQFITDINSKLNEADIEAKVSTKRFTHKEVFEKIKKIIWKF